MHILISDKVSPKCPQILKQAGHEVDEISGLSPKELKAIIGSYHGLIVRSATKVTSDILQMAKNLQVIGRAGSGVDNIDVEAATAKDVLVMNTPGGNSNAVAELTLSFILCLSRDLYSATSSLKDERWEKKKFRGTEITDKTLGIIGYGRVSRLLAQKCKALGMHVFCYDPKINKDIVDNDSLQILSALETVLSCSHYISVHLNKREETTNFIAKAQFEQMNDGAYFINTSRGGIVNEDDLLWALGEGIIARAAIDVYDVEPPTQFSLIQHPHVTCTPHIGASTQEAQENVAVRIADQMVDMFAGKAIQNAVNQI
ncbi:hypothetical protein GWN26_03190 [Candidatus Saccharibacteria bacterium]|nr:hypothetical protein [Calditrichia bacterium]NIV72509.1 hypothetical protein [Calditrichia bacterium]NIV98191.1 hypothetical protein [Candidatus Saccharibacteria bacterium]